MNLNGFDLNLLVALDALLSERSVTRAAERLHVTQPAMSNSLQRIRQWFDDQILERSGRELQLTPIAVELVEPVRTLLGKAGHILRLSDGFVPATATRTFRVAMSDYCAMVLLPVIIGRVAGIASAVRVEIETLNERSLERLLSRQLDFCVSVQDLLLVDVAVDGLRLHRSEIFRDRFVSATGPEHCAVDLGLTRDTFLDSPHVSYRSGVGTRSLEQTAKDNMGLSVNVTVVTPTLSAMPLVLRDTNLVATFPSRLSEALGHRDRFRLFPCPVDMPELIETLYWHPLAEGDLGHDWMRQLILDAGVELGEMPSLSV